MNAEGISIPRKHGPATSENTTSENTLPVVPHRRCSVGTCAGEGPTVANLWKTPPTRWHRVTRRRLVKLVKRLVKLVKR
jgi:hypothetical protein